MAYNIKKIDDTTWTIENLMGNTGSLVRIFLLAGKEKALMIDAGVDTKDAKEICDGILKDAGLDLPIIFAITHAHGDHLAGAGAFKEFYVTKEDFEAFNLQEQYPNAKLMPIFDGYEFDLGERKVTVLENPGHSVGSVAFLDEGHGILITGDSVQNGHIYMFGKTCAYDKFGDSLIALAKKTEGKFDKLFGCHGDAPLGPDQIMKVYEAWNKVQKFENNEATAEELGISFKEIDMNGNKVRDYDCKDCYFFYGR